MLKNYKSIIISAVAVGLLLFIGGGWSWWHLVYSSPKNTFQRMISSSLSSPSSTKVQKNDSDIVEESKKSIQRNTPNAIVKTETASSKKGTDLAIAEESIASLHEEYSKYTVLNIEKQNGRQNYNDIIGVWSRVDDEAAKDDVQSVARSIFNVVPIVQLTESDRQEIVQYIKDNNVYTVDYDSVKRMNVDGRPHYIYAIEMNTYEYVSMLKKLAGKLNMHLFDNINADNYKNSQPAKFNFDVDVWSGQLVSFDTADGSSKQEYGAYGIQVPINFPKNYISKDEFQNKINSKQ